jgi:opacity protein-like surface antigen
MRRLVLLTAVALVAGAVGAKAADLGLPPPPPPPPPPPQDFGGWYLRGDVGVGAYQLTNYRSTFADWSAASDSPPTIVARTIGDAAFAGAGVGYQFNNWFRFDVTGEYRTAAQFDALGTFGHLCDCGTVLNYWSNYHGQLSAAVFMANAYFDLGNWYGITPFIGGGVGLAATSLQGPWRVDPEFNQDFSVAGSRNQTNFAWQVGGGLAYNVTPNLKLEVAYRYLNLGNFTTGILACNVTDHNRGCAGEKQSFNLASNDVKIGFRYVIPTLTPAPPPLVRKY